MKYYIKLDKFTEDRNSKSEAFQLSFQVLIIIYKNLLLH